MNELMEISGVKGFADDNGMVQLNLEDVARGLGFVDNSKGPEYVRWNTVTNYLKSFGFSQEVAKDTFIPENIFYRLAMKAKNEIAEAFQIKVADEILPSIRKTGSYAAKPMSMLEIIAANAQALVDHDKQLREVRLEVQGIREVVALNATDWRKDTTALLNKMSLRLNGDYGSVKELRAESYKMLDERFAVDVHCRLTNKRRRMADEGVCKSKRDSLNPLDVIGEDKKLIEGYVTIIKDMAIRYGASIAERKEA